MCENAKVMYRLRKSKNAEASAEVCVKCESVKATCATLRILSTSKPTRKRLQNRYTHEILSMDWLSGILKRDAKMFGVWLAEKGV